MNFIKKNLKQFNLTIQQADAEILSDINKTEVNLQNDTSSIDVYKIRYYNMYGNPTAHYRVVNATHQDDDLGSLQFYGINTGHKQLYYPKNFMQTFNKFKIKFAQDSTIIDNNFIKQTKKKTQLLVITDDERKALDLTYNKGIPSVAMENPNAYDVDITTMNDFQKLLELCLHNNVMVVLWFTDNTDRFVRQGACSLAYYMLFKGVSFMRVRSFEKKLKSLEKWNLVELLKGKSALPKHPDVRHYIETIKETAINGRMTAKLETQIAIAVVADMESNGKRIRNRDTKGYYYFDNTTRVLFSCDMVSTKNKMVDKTFPDFLTNKYGIMSASARIISDITDIYKSKEPIFETKSFTFLDSTIRTTNSIAIQLNTDKYIAIKPNNKKVKKFKLYKNGDEGLLFSSKLDSNSQTYKLNEKKVMQHLKKFRKRKVPQFFWNEVLATTRVQDVSHVKKLLALNCYINPWLMGWRNSQFPIEIAIGASSVGKSSTFQLRKIIMNGETALPALQESMGKFITNITNTSGLTVFDNVELSVQALKPFSNEICRLVTDINPVIKDRTMYTNNDEIEMPVTTTFGFTCVSPQFRATDFINRSIFAEYVQDRSKTLNTTYYNWVEFQLKKYGGRERWFAHHLDILERFFTLVEKEWDNKKYSSYRIINYEQSLEMMCKVFGIKYKWVNKYLREMVILNSLKYDLALQGIHIFCRRMFLKGHTTFTYHDMWEYCKNLDTFKHNMLLKNEHKFDEYIKNQETTVFLSCGIIRSEKNYRVKYSLNKKSWETSLKDIL